MVTSSPSPSSEQNKREELLQVDDTVKLMKIAEDEKKRAVDYLNRLKYLQADFENYKKRVKKEIDEQIKYANRRLILELLTVIDELECAVEAGKKGTSDVFLEGVEMTLSKLSNILNKEGLVRIDSVGQVFDPNKHEAVFRVPTKNREGIILDEIRKGYILKDMVIRPSLVKVGINKNEKVKKDE